VTGLPFHRRVAMIAMLLIISIGTVAWVNLDLVRRGNDPDAAGASALRPVTSAQARVPPTDGTSSQRPPVPASQANQAAQGNQVPAHPSDAIDDLLAARSSAVRTGDRAGWLAGLLPDDATGASAAFTAAQRTLFDRVRAVRPLEWTYQVAGGSPLSQNRRAALGGTAWLADVRLDYRLTSGGPRVRRQQYLTIVGRGDRWWIAADSDGPTARDVWDLGPVVRAAGGRCLVVGARSRDRQVRQMAAECDRPAARVDGAWGRSWPRRTVLTVPATLRQLAVLLGRRNGRQTDGLSGTAAVTIGPADGAADGVLVNGAAFDQLSTLGRRVVLTHEFVHVATRATGSRFAPTWLSEGFADYVAYRGTGLTTAQVAGAAIDAVRAGHVPSRLPRQGDFDAASAGAETAYDESWVAVGLIAARAAGDGEMKRFYQRAATSDDDPGALDAALAAAGLRDVRSFTAVWQARLRQIAR
jgi:hypothetical protein